MAPLEIVQFPCSEKGRLEQVSLGLFQSGCDCLGDTHSPACLDKPSQSSFNGEKRKEERKVFLNSFLHACISDFAHCLFSLAIT